MVFAGGGLILAFEGININALIKMTSPFGRRLGRPKPPGPGEPVPSVPPVGKADGAPLRYGGLRAA
jgi:hypothetical protein